MSSENIRNCKAAQASHRFELHHRDHPKGEDSRAQCGQLPSRGPGSGEVLGALPALAEGVVAPGEGLAAARERAAVPGPAAQMQCRPERTCLTHWFLECCRYFIV